MTKDLSSPWNKEDTLPWAGINKFNAQAVINLKWGIRYFTVKYPATQFSPERSVSYPLPVRERKGYYLKKYAEVRETIDDQGMSLKYNPDKECTPHPIDILVRELSKENICTVLLDLSAPGNIDEILMAIRKQLLMWRKSLKISRPRAAKEVNCGEASGKVKKKNIWRFYLMIYDLVEKGLSVKEAGEFLANSYEIYAEEKTAANHFMKAYQLIDEYGFRKMLEK